MLEREDEIARVSALLDAAGEGSGRLVLVEGPAGIGKTTLLKAARSVAADRGFATLSARCSLIEQEFAFGVARQLFERKVRALNGPARAEVLSGAAALADAVVLGSGVSPGIGAPRASIFPSLHGLFWLCANLADRAPLLITIDDAQWADDPSVRWLDYLSRRLEDVAALIAIARRPAQPDDRAGQLGALVGQAGGDLITLDPLSEQATAQLAGGSLGADIGSELARECHLRTGGNPFLLRELLSAMSAAPDDRGRHDLRIVRGVRPVSVTRTVFGRLAAMPDGCRSMAEAVAVLETDVQLRQAAALSELPLAQAAAAIETLTAGEILVGGESIGFVHPLVRDALYGELTDTRRGQLHRRAAEILYAEGAAPERVGAHLLPAYRAGESWAVAQLRQAARNAIARGANGPVAAYLERALAEPAERGERPQLLLELGRARARNSPVEAAADLEQALGLTVDPLMRAELARARSAALMNSARVVEAFTGLECAIAELPSDADRELRLRMEAEVLAIGMLAPALNRRAADRIDALPDLAGDTPGERLVLANLARHRWHLGAPAREAADLAERALAGGALLDDQEPDSPTLGMTISILLQAGRRAQAASLVELLHRDASRRGSVMGAAIATSLMASLQFRSGDVRALEALSRRALELSLESHWLPGLPLIVAFLLTALTRRGGLEEAEATLARFGLDGDIPDTVSFFDWLLLARGALRIAQRRPREGLDDLLELGRRERVGNRDDGTSWQAHAVPALIVLGQHEQARELADAALVAAIRRDTPWHVGVAHRTLGLAVEGEAGIDHLQRAAELLAGSTWRLERAHALADVGAALRRSNRRADARPYLLEALDLAHRCGAAPLEETIRTELRAAGARPRRLLLTGVDALTASELRIAQMAAAGMTNRQIAQALFITIRTVTTHLGHVYEKLDIRGRDQLSNALEGDSDRLSGEDPLV